MSIQKYQEHVEECARVIAPRLGALPEWGVILGTGQRLLAQHLEDGGYLPYEELPHFPRATSPSHQGRFHWGRLAGKPVVLCHGRLHGYEGYSLLQATFTVRVMTALGIKTLALTNAAGGLNPYFKTGELMLICDHINFMADNPLVGENVDAWGPRFPDMSRVYDHELMDLAEDVARRRGIVLRKGVYVGVKGPSLETPAETRLLRIIGADAVGMSTVPEAICAVHAGIKVLGISILSNVNLPDAMAPISLEEIIATVARAEPRLAELLLGVIAETPASGTR
ncbi:MAG: purine-nucleoside phosphorylase [Deltaproteobacteria bacterium]|nr:purine-nucleoside phosphorylase [Deltaproteobacteria bacterium]